MWFSLVTWEDFTALIYSRSVTPRSKIIKFSQRPSREPIMQSFFPDLAPYRLNTE